MVKWLLRPITASPECARGSNPDLDASPNDNRTPFGICKRDPQAPDSIEGSTSTLFTRMRALRASRPEATLANSPGDATGTSSYYGDGESRSSVGRQDLGANAMSTSSSSGVIAFGSISQHSAPDSTFMNDNPTSASYLQSSRLNIHKRYLNGRKLDIVSCPREAFREQNDDDLGDSSGDDTEEDPQITDGGLDPEEIRKRILDRPPSEPISTTDSIVAVVYDGSSGSRHSMRPTTGLFARKLVLRENANPVKTPPNSIETPQPLMNITQPTPEVWYKEGANTTATSTGAGIESLRSDEYGYANSTVPGAVSERGSSLGDSRSAVGENSLQVMASEDSHSKWFRSYNPPCSPLATRLDSGVEEETACITSPNKTHQSLCRAPRSSELGWQEPRPEVSIRFAECAPIGIANQTVIPQSAGSLHRVICDLEGMFWRALRLAGGTVARSQAVPSKRYADPGRGGSARSSVATPATSAGHSSRSQSFKTASEPGQGDRILTLPTEGLGTTETTNTSTVVVRNHDSGFIGYQGEYRQRPERDPHPEPETEALRVSRDRDVHRKIHLRFICRESQPSQDAGPTDGGALGHSKAEEIQVLQIAAWTPRSKSQPAVIGIQGGGIGAYEKRELRLQLLA